MKLMKRWLYAGYRTLEDVPGIMIVSQYIYNRILPVFKPEFRGYCYLKEKELPLEKTNSRDKYLKNIKIAIICDEMTYRGFELECECRFITPSNWMEVFREFKPDLFFCESAWSGIKEHHDCWRSRIYKCGGAGFENRRDLLHILDFCKRSSIPTVFWNKEDPTYFGDKNHDFVSTALLFDYIYTSAQECITKYEALGHKKVQTLMFGFSPKLFNPLGSKPNGKKAIFAGSWYGDQPKRCKDMSDIFEEVLEVGLELEIYDRHWESSNRQNLFPEKYRRYTHKGVDFEKLCHIFKEASFGININTVEGSKTMFARRVFEMMASNLLVISNDSVGLREMFKEHIWFPKEGLPIGNMEQIRRDNLRYVFLNHTCEKRLLQVATDIGILKHEALSPVYIIYEGEKTEALKHFNAIAYEAKQGLWINADKLMNLEDESYLSEEELNKDGFVIWIGTEKPVLDLEFMKAHFSYIEENYGICQNGESYTIASTTDNRNALFRMKMYETLKGNINRVTKKYFI